MCVVLRRTRHQAVGIRRSVKKSSGGTPWNREPGQIELVIGEARQLIELDNWKSLSTARYTAKQKLELVTGVQLGGTGGHKAAPHQKTCPFTYGTIELSENKTVPSTPTLPCDKCLFTARLFTSAHTSANFQQPSDPERLQTNLPAITGTDPSNRNHSSSK